jgi:hypothetical protein
LLEVLLNERIGALLRNIGKRKGFGRFGCGGFRRSLRADGVDDDLFRLLASAEPREGHERDEPTEFRQAKSQDSVLHGFLLPRNIPTKQRVEGFTAVAQGQP